MLIQYLYLGSIKNFKIATNSDNITHVISLNIIYLIIGFNRNNIAIATWIVSFVLTTNVLTYMYNKYTYIMYSLFI